MFQELQEVMPYCGAMTLVPVMFKLIRIRLGIIFDDGAPW